MNFSSDFEPKPASYYEPAPTTRRVTVDEEPSYIRNERRRAPEENKGSRRNEQSSGMRFISDIDESRLNKTQTYSNYQPDYQNQSTTYAPPRRGDHQRSATNIQPFNNTQNINIEDYGGYSNKRDQRMATIGNDYDIRRSTQQENDRQSRVGGGYTRNDIRVTGPTGEDYRQQQEQSRAYQPRSTKNVNESYVVFGTNQEIGKSPASKPREKTRSPEREGIAAGRPTTTGYDDKKLGIKSDGYTQKGTTNLLTWTGQPADESRSRGNSPDKRMFAQTMNYSKKEEPTNGNFVLR